MLLTSRCVHDALGQQNLLLLSVRLQRSRAKRENSEDIISMATVLSPMEGRAILMRTRFCYIVVGLTAGEVAGVRLGG